MRQYLMQICIVICLFISMFIFITIRMNSDDKNKIKIGVTYMTMNNTFYEVITNEIKKVVNEKNDILYIRDPALNVEKQIQQINDFIDLDIDYLIINPVDSTKIALTLKKVKKQGIKIIVVDAPISDDEIADCTIVSDNYDAGVQCAKNMMAHLDKANIVLLEHNSVISAIDRINGFLDTIKDNPRYKVIDRADCLGQTEIALPKMREIIAKNRNFQVVMSLNDPSALGALAALEESGMNNVFVYGVDGSPDMKKLISSSNNAQATASQSPISMGQEAINIVYKMKNQEKYEKQIIIPVAMIEKSNIDHYSLSGWQ